MIFAFRYIIVIFLLAPLLVSCDSKMVFEQNKALPDQKWDAEKKLHYVFTVSDTVSLYNLYINIRNTGEYKYSNLYVFVDVFLPDGNFKKDTIECILADHQGRWLGKSGSGSIWDNQVLFNRKARFPKQGKYVIRFEQAMREKELEHIMEVGLRLEKSHEL